MIFQFGCVNRNHKLRRTILSKHKLNKVLKNNILNNKKKITSFFNKMSSESLAMKKKMVHKRFTEEEDNKLRDLVKIYGENQWLMISSRMGTRNSRQCRDRWCQYLSPKSNLSPWSKEEENLLVKLVQEYKGKWLEILKRFPGRSYNQIKNKYKTLERRKKVAELKNYNFQMKSLNMQNKLFFAQNMIPVYNSFNCPPVQATKDSESETSSPDEFDFEFDCFEDPCLWD